MNTDFSELDHLHDNKKGHDYRVLSIYSDVASLCQIDSSKIEIWNVPVSLILKNLQDGTFTKISDKKRIFDMKSLSTEQIEEFKFRKSFLDDVIGEYAPTFTDIASKKSKPVIQKYLQMKDENGHARISRTVFWKIVRNYLQSGFQDSAILDQRQFMNHAPESWTTTPGRNSTTGEKAKLLTDDDYKNFNKYMKRYLHSEVKTQTDAYFDMVSDCYYQTVNTLNEEGQRVCKRIPLPNSEIPTYKQFNRYVSLHSTKKERLESKKTKRVVRNNSRVFTGTVMNGVKGPAHMCEVDAQEMDIAMVSEEYPNVPVGRPILYVIIDVMSEIILGVSLAMDNNSVVGLTNVFMNLLENKETMYRKYCDTEFSFTEGMTMDDVWPTGYRPLIMKFDNGSDFISKDIARILNELCITPRIITAATGSLKPLVEEFFSGIKKDLDDMLEHKGLIRDTYGSKHHQEACITYSDAMAIVLNHVLAHNCHAIKSYPKSADMKRKHILATPANLWKYGCQTMRMPAKFASRDQAIYSILQPETGITLNRQGIHFKGIVYFNPEDSVLNEKAFNTGNKKVPFEARTDPRDMGHIYYLRDGELMCASVPTEDFRMRSYIGMSRKQFDELSNIETETKKKEEILNREIRIDKRCKNKAIIDVAASKHDGENDVSSMRQSRKKEKARISAANSVSERFNLHPEETIEQIGKLAKKVEQKKPEDQEAEKGKDNLLQVSDSDSLEEIHRKMVEASKNMLDDY